MGVEERYIVRCATLLMLAACAPQLTRLTAGGMEKGPEAAVIEQASAFSSTVDDAAFFEYLDPAFLVGGAPQAVAGLCDFN